MAVVFSTKRMTYILRYKRQPHVLFPKYYKFLRLSLLAETPTVERTPDGENSGREGNELSAPNPKRKSVSKPA